MNRHALIRRALAVGLLGALAAGCQTYRRPIYSTNEPVIDDEQESEYNKREEQLVEATKEQPEEPSVWFALGKFYEDSQRLREAVGAYEHLKTTTEAKYPGKTFTGPDYSLGKVYAQLGEYAAAVQHLRSVLASQPEELTQASLNRHFRESHLLLAAIYYDNAQWDPAEEHALAYLDLGGEEVRGERLLMDIRYARDHAVRR